MQSGGIRWLEDDEDVVNSDGDTADSDSDSEDDMAAKDFEYRLDTSVRLLRRSRRQTLAQTCITV